MTATDGEGESDEAGDADATSRAPAISLDAPTPESARAHVERALDRDALVTVFGRCTVEYDGRASSELGPGERHLMCKPDGTVLVHTTEGQQPVNWQPPGCEHEVRVADGDLRIRSQRSNPDEELVARFERVVHLAAFDATDEETLAVSGTEADLKERILADPDLVEEGFSPLATERDTPAGAIDIYGEDESGTTTILELKRRRVGPDAAGQLDRYVAALRRDLHADAAVRGILVAPSITDRARRLLARKGLGFVSLTPTGE